MHHPFRSPWPDRPGFPERPFAWRPPFNQFGFPGHGRGRHGGGWGPGARRGDVRAAILALLAERPMHGYEMIRELESRTNGVWRPSPGSIYPTLQMLADEGLISSDEAGGRRLFTLTDAGRAEVERQAAPRTPWEQFTHGDEPSLRDAIGQLAFAVIQVTRAGTPEQRAKAMEIITETRRRLYAILAEDAG